MWRAFDGTKSMRRTPHCWPRSWTRSSTGRGYSMSSSSAASAACLAKIGRAGAIFYLRRPSLRASALRSGAHPSSPSRWPSPISCPTGTRRCGQPVGSGTRVMACSIFTSTCGVPFRSSSFTRPCSPSRRKATPTSPLGSLGTKSTTGPSAPCLRSTGWRGSASMASVAFHLEWTTNGCLASRRRPRRSRAAQNCRCACSSMSIRSGRGCSSCCGMRACCGGKMGASMSTSR
mmetsp:Transcript_21708/g.70114  ORF Transcript_21708/g.70114 Transcript_21708/m.70114 type:complete len:232 (+) Transcript_21708:540-1235(+)